MIPRLGEGRWGLVEMNGDSYRFKEGLRKKEAASL